MSARVVLLLWLVAATGCAALLPRPGREVADNFMLAVLESDDVATVREGMPPFLLLLDGLIRGSPDDVDMLTAGAALNASYSGLIAGDPARNRVLARKAFDYAMRALTLRRPDLADVRDCTFDQFRARMRAVERDDLPVVFTLGSAWMARIKAERDSLDAIADLARLQLLMERVIELDDAWRDGAAHLYLGSLLSMQMPGEGGDLEPARAHFQSVLDLSNGTDLMAKLLLALRYAEPAGKADLRDRLLREIDAADPHAPRRTLINVMAQAQARALLRGEDPPFSPF